jgi:hypothetical protein
MVALQLSNHVTGLFTVIVNELFPPQIIVDSFTQEMLAKAHKILFIGEKAPEPDQA